MSRHAAETVKQLNVGEEKREYGPNVDAPAVVELT